MVFPLLETPRTDAGDQTHLSATGVLDFTTENSIPSPSKGSNDLLRQIRGMRAPNKAVKTTPRARQPLLDRRNVPTKTEFTPLLKSATRNRHATLGSSVGKENGILQTPAGLKASYHGRDSPALPLSSSIMEEQYTGSFLANGGHGTPMMPASSSSALSTPMAVLPGRGGGPLDHGNMATLKEQEARLEQIDKENFSLKLKIHFMEEALKRNGKEFNEAAIKENTELKVDKVTLQRDLKHYRRLLSQAERDLEDYKRQLLEHAEQVKRKHTGADILDELDELRRSVSDKEEQIRRLEHDLEKAEDEGYDKCNDENRIALNELRDTIADLEADLRDRDRQLDERQDEIDSLRDQRVDTKSQGELEDLRTLVQERDDDIKSLHSALNKAGVEYDAKLREKDKVIEHKDDALRDLEDQMKGENHDRSFAIRSKQQELELRDKELEEARKQVEKATEKAQEADSLREQLRVFKDNHAEMTQRHTMEIKEKDYQIDILEEKLSSSPHRDNDITKLQDQITDLEADIREKERSIDQRDDQLDDLKSRLQILENETDDELIAAQDRIQELEIDRERNVKELGSLRDALNDPVKHKSEVALREAEARIRELQDDASYGREEEQRLQKELDRLRGDVQRLEKTIGDREEEINSEKQAWSSQRQTLEFARSAADKQAEALRKNISQLQQIEGNLSGKEAQLQKMLDSERERHENDESQLRQEINRITREKESCHGTISSLRREIQQTRQDQQAEAEQKHTFKQKIIELEEEVEVLQSEADEDVARLQGQLDKSQQELVRVKTDLENAVTQFNSSAASHTAKPSSLPEPDSSPQRSLQRRVLELETQLLAATTERQELQDRLSNAETIQNHTQADLGTLQLDLQAASGSRSQWQQKLQDAQNQVNQMRKEKRALQDTVGTTSTELNALQTAYNDLEDSNSTLERQLRELRIQVTQLHRDGDRKIQSQVAAYEHDIQNLEQDLADAEVKYSDLLKKNEISESAASRQRSRIASLEAEIAALRNSTGGAKATSPEERQDLHEMLKDAKLEAEDLALQLKERNMRLSTASTKEDQLRAQLRRAREDRASITSRADADMAEIELLRNQILQMEVQAAELRKENRSSRALGKPTPQAVEQRHTAELKGLARQIEYLSARCRREEAFRSDLGFVKQYFQKTVEMYGRCNALDLKLVKSMGIATSQVMRDERTKERLEGPGRVALAGIGVGRKRKGFNGMEERSRPTFKVVALMVLAGVRMQSNAEKWAAVRGKHEELLKKLRVLKKGKDGQPHLAPSLGKRKTLK